MSPALAYGVSVRGKVQTNTVHGHARGAMVNFVVTSTGGHGITDATSDEGIRDRFLEVQRRRPDLSIALVLLSLEPLGETNAQLVDLTAEPARAA